ncbi:helix-turn-helix transcriptional regulator [Altererythrobacter sp. CC-YST694]|uniref:XRE family transcriptional regulator n=1 Tax=Altererythrobacter sp. CC-YST694 TaxID=2755038 RepID=UPI001D01E149|nr:S24 family peptidase [Altererythrobacter sp. CC-YST694]MCB5423939.1 helix-turn-helix transcriptional regulator [Altererythrobacter sp. CC-YST694]
MRTGERIAELRNKLGLSQTQLAKQVGLSQATIGKLESGISSGSSHLHKIARALGTTAEYLSGETDDPSVGALPVPSAHALAEQLDLVEVQEIDLRFGMGATALEVPVTKQVRHFSRDWLRQYTSANPEAVYFAQGAGDSMMPTIHDSDLLLIDTSQQNMTLADKIWAVAYCGSGMVKRLRPTPDGVKILSDNPAVPPEVAHDGELHILGRVVGIVRKM